MLLFHEAGNARNCRVCRLFQRSNHILLILASTILAELEFGLHLRDLDLKTYNLFEHALAEGLVQAGPLRGVRRLEGPDQFVEHALQCLWRRKDLRVSIKVHSTIVPGRNAFVLRVVARRDVGVRSVKNGQTLWLLFEVAPVWVRLCHMAAENNFPFLWRPVHEEWKVRSERPRASG